MSMTLEPPEGALVNDPNDAIEIVTVWRRCAVEHEASTWGALVGAVEEARVEVNIQVQARTEALNEGDRAWSRGRAASGASVLEPASIPLTNGLGEDPRECGEHLRVEGGERAKLERAGEHPLAHGDCWEDSIDESRRLVRHPAPRATRAHRALLTGEDDKQLADRTTHSVRARSRGRRPRIGGTRETRPRHSEGAALRRYHVRARGTSRDVHARVRAGPSPSDGGVGRRARAPTRRARCGSGARSAALGFRSVGYREHWPGQATRWHGPGANAAGRTDPCSVRDPAEDGKPIPRVSPFVPAPTRF